MRVSQCLSEIGSLNEFQIRVLIKIPRIAMAIPVVSESTLGQIESQEVNKIRKAALFICFLLPEVS